MRFNWFPWKFIIRRIARSHGLLDPVLLLSQFNKFAQPSEVAAPVELLRASLVLHARGLLNARTIQTNLDWIWPFWVQRQFDPMDAAFVPRSYTLTHVNLSHRNWTAVGFPDCDAFPIVDPRGMVTPFLDGWSLDGWILSEDGSELLPGRVDEVNQQVVYDPDRWVVETEVSQSGLRLKTAAQVLLRAGDDRYLPIIERAVEMASPTGQWPEAIHPRTLGGCQGDGQHIWAAAEWVMMLRNMMVREEEDRLVLLQGIPKEWLCSGGEIIFGPVHTAFGTLRIRLFPVEGEFALHWDAEWREDPPILEICLPGYEKRAVNGGRTRTVSLIRSTPHH